MTKPESVVVYRSRAEQAYDEFLYNHPEIALGVITVLVGLFVGAWAWDLVANMRRRRRWRL